VCGCVWVRVAYRGWGVGAWKARSRKHGSECPARLDAGPAGRGVDETLRNLEDDMSCLSVRFFARA